MSNRRVTRALIYTAALLAAVATVTLAVRVVPASDAGGSPPEPGTGATRALLVIAAIAVVIVAIALAAALQDGRPRVAPDVPAAGAVEGSLSAKSRRQIIAWTAGACVLVIAAYLLGSAGVDDPPAREAPAVTESEGNSDSPTEIAPPTELPPPSDTGEARRNQAELWTAAAVVGPVLVALLILGAAARRPVMVGSETPIPVGTDTASDAAQSLVRAAEVGLATVVTTQMPPREAIIASYAAMEDALRRAPGAEPRDSDTPSEVLARAVQLGVLHSEAAAPLVRLFAEARFSRHPMDERHRAEAVDLLECVLDDVGSNTCSPLP
ncbi:DUF4129 domain-containing protein [Rhodococcus tibetensis]|uniref:DUF4129 domain-containing protein n=1 Tax=Rhodococcus tibetensis TaxID=2965064 RepID=A0ABT1Q5X0_9NOCA|nr:DUF4129 domain-containing protein [Rhodococcus sp. FXJ9.536]MCQ4117653.1 DUF4129 domain-containing protein [Rhodococcus sp. FXJ9.536]